MTYAMMRHSLKNKTVLVTYGPTWVALDDMRILSNRSTGKMGKSIIGFLIKAGAKVTALEGPIREPLHAKHIRIKKFMFFDEFKRIFKSELRRRYDIVIHAAAVSDFKPQKKYIAKIASDKPVTLTLFPTEKLIKCVKRYSPRSTLVGFKLASLSSQQALKKCALDSIRKNRCDLVVANSLKNGYTGFIFDHQARVRAKAKTRKTLSKQLVQCLCELGEES